MSGPGDLDTYKVMYPWNFKEMRAGDIVIFILLFILPFLIVYLYVRFIEDRLTLFNQNRSVIFINFRVKLGKIINFIDRMFKTNRQK